MPRTNAFDVIHQRALERKGGEAGLAAWMPSHKTPAQLRKLKGDRVLAEMTRCLFQAGFAYRVINHKWPGFEQAFWKFDPDKLVLLSPEQLEALGRDKRIVRNQQKISTVPHNAQFVRDIAREHGSFGRFLADWPNDDQVGLCALLKKRGARLGGMTGPRVLRNLGWDTYALTGDVIRCLQGAGIEVRDNPTSQAELRAIQQTFNDWHDASGLPYGHISRICACSVGENYPDSPYRPAVAD